MHDFYFYRRGSIVAVLPSVTHCFPSPGMNALVMYVGHQICYQLFPFHWQLGPMNTHLMVLLENVWGVLLWILVAVFLYRRKVFVSV